MPDRMMTMFLVSVMMVSVRGEPCPVTNGTIANVVPCTCGTASSCTSTTGLFCNSEIDSCTMIRTSSPSSSHVGIAATPAPTPTPVPTPTPAPTQAPAPESPAPESPASESPSPALVPNAGTPTVESPSPSLSSSPSSTNPNQLNSTSPSSDRASIYLDEITTVLSPLTPLGRHLLSVVGLVLGTFALVVGKKCLRITLFMVGFCVGFCVAALICHRAQANPQVLLVVSAIVGSLFGGLSSCIGGIAKMAVAASAGFLVTLTFVKTGMFSPLDPGQDYIIWLILVVFILLCMWITTKFFDVAVVIVTSCGGALLVTISIIHFIPAYNFNAIAILSNPTEMPLCDSIECIGAFLLWGLLSSLGLAIQWRIWDSAEDDDDDRKDDNDLESNYRSRRRRGTCKDHKGKRRSSSRYKEQEMVDSRRKSRRSSSSSKSKSSSSFRKKSSVRRGSNTKTKTGRRSSKKYKKIGRNEIACEIED